MPNQYGFHVLGPGRRCVECDWPGDNDTPISEAAQRKHQATHVRERKREIEKTQRQNLAKGRKVLRQMERENGIANRSA